MRVLRQRHRIVTQRSRSTHRCLSRDINRGLRVHIQRVAAGRGLRHVAACVDRLAGEGMRTRRLVVRRRREGGSSGALNRGRLFVMIPLVGYRTVSTRGYTRGGTADGVHVIPRTNRLTAADRTSLELLIHRQHIAARGFRPLVAALVFRHTGEGVRACLLAVARWGVAGSSGFGDGRAVVVPLVFHRQLTTHRLRVGNGGYSIIGRAVTNFLMRHIRIDGARIELVAHRNGHVVIIRGRAGAHGGCHCDVIGRGGRERSGQRRVCAALYRFRAFALRPRVSQSIVGGGVCRQGDRASVTNRLVLDIRQRHLRVIHCDGDLAGLYRRGTVNIIHRLHGIDLNSVSGSLRWSHHIIGGSTRLKHCRAFLPRIGVRVARIRRGVGCQLHRRALTNRGVGYHGVVIITIYSDAI